MAWQLFIHSFRQVTGNLGPALRIAAVLMLVQFAVSNFFSSRMPVMPTDPEALPVMPEGFAITALLFLAVTMITGPWVAVAWHRFVLLEEEPNAVLPVWRGAEIGAYIITMIKLGLMALFGAIVIAIPVSFVLVATGGAADTTPILIGVAVFLPVAYAVNRVSLILAAAAVGEKIGILQAFRMTASGAGPIFMLTMMLLGCGLVAQIIAVALFAIAPIIGMVVQALLSLFLFLLGASVMTTLYGHYAQGRALVTQ